MELTIETLTGSVFDIRVSPFDSIMAVKAKIQRIEGIPISQQHLIWDSRELDDSCSLRDYEIRSGAKIKLVLAMRGGPVNMRRVSSASSSACSDTDSQTAWMDMAKYVQSNKTDLIDKLPPSNKQLTLLLVRDGDNIQFYHLVDGSEDGVTPVSEALSAGESSYPNSNTDKDDDPSCSNDTRGSSGAAAHALHGNRKLEDKVLPVSEATRLILENSKTMDKVRVLKAQMQQLKIGKKVDKNELSRIMPDHTKQESTGAEPPSASVKNQNNCSNLMRNNRSRTSSVDGLTKWSQQITYPKDEISRIGSNVKLVESVSSHSCAASRQDSRTDFRLEGRSFTSMKNDGGMGNNVYPPRHPLTYSRGNTLSGRRMPKASRTLDDFLVDSSSENVHPPKREPPSALNPPKRFSLTPNQARKPMRPAWNHAAFTGKAPLGSIGGSTSSTSLQKQHEIRSKLSSTSVYSGARQQDAETSVGKMKKAESPSDGIHRKGSFERLRQMNQAELQQTLASLDPRISPYFDQTRNSNSSTSPSLSNSWYGQDPDPSKQGNMALFSNGLLNNKRPPADKLVNFGYRNNFNGDETYPYLRGAALSRNSLRTSQSESSSLSTDSSYSGSNTVVPNYSWGETTNSEAAYYIRQYREAKEKFERLRNRVYSYRSTEQAEPDLEENLGKDSGDFSYAYEGLLTNSKFSEDSFSGNFGHNITKLSDMKGSGMNLPPIGNASVSEKKPSKEDAKDVAGTSSKSKPDIPQVGPSKSKSLRCQECNKRVGPASTYNCRCGGRFCAQHRYPETHPCTYDYKSEGRKIIEQNNPKVTAVKLPKI